MDAAEMSYVAAGLSMFTCLEAIRQEVKEED